MAAPLETTWIRYLRENHHARESFFRFLGQVRASSMKQFANIKTQEAVWRLQGDVRTVDFITQFVQKELQGQEEADGGRDGKDPRTNRR